MAGGNRAHQNVKEERQEKKGARVEPGQAERRTRHCAGPGWAIHKSPAGPVSPWVASLRPMHYAESHVNRHF